MEVSIVDWQGTLIAEVMSEGLCIRQGQDVLDLFGSLYGTGARCVLLREEHLAEDFFDLRTRLAGDILQKFSNYRIPLAVVGAFDRHDSRAWQSFVAEYKQGKEIFFVTSREEALDRLAAA